MYLQCSFNSLDCDCCLSIHTHAQISNEVLFLGIVVILRRETSSSLSRVCRRPFKELKTKVLFFIRFLFFLFYFSVCVSCVCCAPCRFCNKANNKADHIKHS